MVHPRLPWCILACRGASLLAVVVQYVLELRRPELTRGIGQALQGSFADLSLQKFSSNVIEKCLKAGDPLLVGMVMREICGAKSLGQLLHDPFANYVVQTLLTEVLPGLLIRDPCIHACGHACICGADSADRGVDGPPHQGPMHTCMWACMHMWCRLC